MASKGRCADGVGFFRLDFRGALDRDGEGEVSRDLRERRDDAREEYDDELVGVGEG